MAIIMYMSLDYSVASARDQLPRLIRDAERGQTVRITRRGKQVAVLLSADVYERLVGNRPDFWEALQSFRARHSLDEAPEDPFVDTRDRSEPREIVL